MTRSLRLCLISAALLGCMPGDETADASTDVPLGDAMAPACDGDVICPLDVPYANTSCHTGLSCPYPAPNCEGPQTAVCTDGRWQIVPPDSMTCLLGGFTPPEPERCRTPFMGTSSSPVTVAVDDEFVWGPQGGAMLAIDVLLEDSPLTCIEARITVRVDGVVEPQARYGLRLRCGASNGLIVVLSSLPCEARDYPVQVDVEITGVGSGSATTMMMGGQTTGLPVCPMD